MDNLKVAQLRQMLNQRLPQLRLSLSQCEHLLELSGHSVRAIMQAATSVIGRANRLGSEYSPAETWDTLKYQTKKQRMRRLADVLLSSK